MNGTLSCAGRALLVVLFPALVAASCKKKELPPVASAGAHSSASAASSQAVRTAVDSLHPNPTQQTAIQAYRLALDVARRGRQPGMPIPPVLLKSLSAATHRLVSVGIDWTRLRADDVLCPNSGSSGLTYTASVCHPTSTTYDSIKSLVYPQFWTPCIRVYGSVDFIGDAPEFNAPGTAQIKEVVYPLWNLPIDNATSYPMTTTLNLTFKVDSDCQRSGGGCQRVDFSFVTGDELSEDAGDIIIQPLDDPTEGSMISIDKKITFTKEDNLVRIFEQNPQALVTNLGYWLYYAENECGSVSSTSFRKSE